MRERGRDMFDMLRGSPTRIKPATVVTMWHVLSSFEVVPKTAIVKKKKCRQLTEV